MLAKPTVTGCGDCVETDVSVKALCSALNRAVEPERQEATDATVC
jgi:hypothetical protein